MTQPGIDARRIEEVGLNALQTQRQLFYDGCKRFNALRSRVASNALPVEQETHEIHRRNRLDLGAQRANRVAVDACQQAPLAPLRIGRLSREPAAQHDIPRTAAKQKRRRSVL